MTEGSIYCSKMVQQFLVLGVSKYPVRELSSMVLCWQLTCLACNFGDDLVQSVVYLMSLMFCCYSDTFFQMGLPTSDDQKKQEILKKQVVTCLIIIMSIAPPTSGSWKSILRWISHRLKSHNVTKKCFNVAVAIS